MTNSDRFHIVILEDNAPDLFMIQESIHETGLRCEITAFTDGAEIMKYINDLSSRVPDLMILDFNVPQVEGSVVLNRVRANPRWAQAGVFMFTASQNPADRARVTLLGVDDCLIKPMDLNGFAAIGRAVKQWLEDKAEP